MFPDLKYPLPKLRLRKKNDDQIEFFDTIRKKWLLLTPEEWVRQHVVCYLSSVKGYSPSLISVEKEIDLNGAKKRYDVVVYDKFMSPHIIIECKAPHVTMNSDVLEQALRYNLVLQVPYVMITNGITDFVFYHNNPLKELPSQ